MLDITIVICTKDRPVDLSNLLESLKNQTTKLDDIIIIDGSDEPTPVKEAVKKFSDLPIRYSTLRPPGLTRQRNVGISKIREESSWVGFLDDDLVLEPEAIANLKVFLKENNDIMGVGLVINNQEDKKVNLLRTLLLTDKAPGGVFTLSGVAASIRPVSSDQKVDWLYGGATFWNKRVLSEFKYDEWFSGVGYSEDVDFSYRVGKKYKLMLHAKSRCWHYHHPTRPERLKDLGTWQIVSWWYFISKHNAFSKILVLYSMIGVLMTNLLIGLVRPSSNRIKNALGNLKGIGIVLFGDVKTHKGFQK